MRYRYIKDNGGDFITTWTNLEERIIDRAIHFIHRNDDFDVCDIGAINMFNSHLLSAAQEHLGVDEDTITPKVVQEMNKLVSDFFLIMCDMILDDIEEQEEDKNEMLTLPENITEKKTN